MTAPVKRQPAAIVFPILAIAYVILAPLAANVASSSSAVSVILSTAMVVIMLGAIFSAVHHADVIAHRVGEPFGTLVLTLAVTVIEVALIESVVLAQKSSPALVRDTVFAVVMIVCNGLVGLCVLVGGLRHREQEYRVSGAGVYLSVLGALSVLTLVLPNYTQTVRGPYLSTSQLIFVSIVTVVLYATFLFIQTSRHADYFRAEEETSDVHDYPSGRAVVVSATMLLVALGAVILMTKKFAVIVEVGIDYVGAPPAVAGIIIAMVVLAPESITAVRAALRNMLQRSINIALGSALATIGLTVPAVAITNVILVSQMELGLSERDTLLLELTLLLSLLTFGSGRTNILNGLVHLVVFATFIFFVFVP
jgi:Ca2+:H+ antiporter